MSRPYEPFDQIMEAPACLRCVTMLLMEGTFFTMIPFGWVHSDGSRPPEVGHVLDHREKLLIGYGKGCEGGLSGRLGPSCLLSDGLGRSRSLALLSCHFWMPVRQPRLVGWLLARHLRALNTLLEDLQTAFMLVLMFSYVERSISIVPRRLPIAARRCLYQSHELSIMHDTIEGVAGAIVCGEFWHKESPWGLVMNDMRAERRGEHVVQPFDDGANGWLVWEVSPSLSVRVCCPGCGYWLLGLPGSLESKLSSWEARYRGVCGSCGLTLPVSGMAPAVPGYIDSGSSLEFATWPLER
ncbi:hypothetical protein CK203_037578 [Vitis vinifera]|uniref:Uncharacterized protein n=1 Tax=Vitis vinifera TaxID=29760 RepID=A0A438HMC3_VITVI|nr:hypothetical protein CK203_037578 [Vitis vinifera]